MIRIIIENILLFLLPTLLYLAYTLLVREMAGPTQDASGDASRTHAGLLDDAPLVYLLAAGMALVVATLVAFGSTSGGKPNEPYTPAEIEDGHVKPGHIN